MKLEHQVANLELSKRLKELGVRQESYFVWEEKTTGPMLCTYHCDEGVTCPWTAAFTVAELGVMLPNGTESWQWDERDCCGKDRHGWSCRSIRGSLEQAETEADARAKMLIYLIENKLVTAEEINRRMGLAE